METFLSETVRELAQGPYPLSDYTLILPSKRAGGFLNQVLIDQTQKVYFAPTVLSIEDFISQVSGIDIMAPTQVLLEGYKVYNELVPTPFNDYLLWAEPLLNDFNELDRNLVSPEAFFSYLSQIKAFERWELKEATPLIKDYLKFWEGLLPFYTAFTQHLLNQGAAYQGLVYRQAAEDLSHYINAIGDKPHAFIGFNALNPAEEILFQEMLAQGNSRVFWDLDEFFAADPQHSVSQFIRKYVENWPYYNEKQHVSKSSPSLDKPGQKNLSEIAANHFCQSKTLHFIESDSDQGQIQALSALLNNISQEQSSKTAIVLADESLLVPVLYAIPEAINQINITMGYPLKAYPGVWFVEALLQWHKSSNKRIHHNHLHKILTHPFGQLLLPSWQNISRWIQKNHQLFIAVEDIVGLTRESEAHVIELMFSNAGGEDNVLKNLMKLLSTLSQHKQLNAVDRIGIQKLLDLLQQLYGLARSYGFLDHIGAITALFDHLMVTESLDFEGDAYQGLQIMGVLETRVLDFEHIIMLSVNEGVIPQGKSSASYITYDMKKEFGLPLHTDKDAIYGYHFFRLIQRATSVTFLYKNSQKGMSVGEPSRFLRLLELTAPNNHIIHKTTALQSVNMTPAPVATYEKTPEVMNKLNDIVVAGLSPSSLGQYVRDPEEFYFRRILGLPEEQLMEDNIAANILGTVVHDAIKEMYAPMAGKKLVLSDLKALKKQVDKIVMSHFDDKYNLHALAHGKNLIVTQVVISYCHQLIDWDCAALERGDTVELLEVETEHNLILAIPGINAPIKLRGVVDRLDRCNGVLRVIDYKTGNVQPSDLNISDWAELTESHKKEKAFQLLTYAYMHFKSDQGFKSFDQQAIAGILSFKNFGQGLMTYAFKPDRYKREEEITLDTLTLYQEQLFELIREILNPQTPFVAEAEG